MSDQTLYRKVVVEHDDGLHHLEYLPVEPVGTLTVGLGVEWPDLPPGEYVIVEADDE